MMVSPEELAKADVSTFHSFALREIIQPFFVPEAAQQTCSIQFVTQESPEFASAVASIETPTPRRLAEYAMLRRALDGQPDPANRVAAKHALRFWGYLEDRGLIDTATLFYRTYEILTSQPHLARVVTARYVAILIDEYQDTSVTQLEILQRLADAKASNLILAGDPDQTLYAFAGVSEHALTAFASSNTLAYCELVDSHRCSTLICRDAQALIHRTPAIRSASTLQGEVFHKNVRDLSVFVIRSFVPSLAARGIRPHEAALLFPITPGQELVAKIRRGGVLCTGDKLRPYSKTIVSEFVESVAAMRKCLDARSIDSGLRAWRSLLSTGAYDRQDEFGLDMQTLWLHRLVLELSIESCATSFVAAIRDCVAAAEYLICSPRRLNDVLPQFEQLLLELAKLSTPATTNELAEYAVVRDSLEILTINGSKGREFRAVAICDLNDGVLPHSHAQADVEERRKLYVAMTRAKELLVYVSTSNRRSRYLEEIEAQKAG